LTSYLKYADSRFFIADKPLLEQYFLPRSAEINDSEGYWFEHCLARAILACISDGGGWRFLPETPIIKGISGSTGEAYYKGRVHLQIKVLKRLIRTQVISR